MILGYCWLRRHDCGIRLGQERLAFDSKYCTTNCTSHGDKVIIKALEISKPSKKHPKSEVLRPRRIIEDSTTPLSMTEIKLLKLLENEMQASKTREKLENFNSAIDIKMCIIKAIQAYARIQTTDAICGIFMRDLKPEIIVEDLNISKIIKGDFEIFMRNKVDPKFQDKLLSIYDAWQDLFSRKAADELTKDSERDHKIRIYQN
ncbi:hypothetical protein K3495_g5531 [Podosphaera aphanis]|nr:hypothetical protein K3495_g5531 [Podosphaera aphanis]